jgi:hypothetical protein
MEGKGNLHDVRNEISIEIENFIMKFHFHHVHFQSLLHKPALINSLESFFMKRLFMLVCAGGGREFHTYDVTFGFKAVSKVTS